MPIVWLAMVRPLSDCSIVDSADEFAVRNISDHAYAWVLYLDGQAQAEEGT